MTEDARFEDADEAPMALRALDEGDLKVLAALVQDAVFPASEMKWDRKRRPLRGAVEPVPLGRGRSPPARTGPRASGDRGCAEGGEPGDRRGTTPTLCCRS
jgi:hypothetical protein